MASIRSRVFSGGNRLGNRGKIISSGFFEQAGNLPAEHGKVRFNDAPDNFIRDRRIPMDEPVAEGYNSMGIADSKTKGWISVDGPVECFPNDLKLALYCRSDQRVVLVIFKCYSPGELRDKIAGFSNIEKLFPDLKRQHTEVPVSLQGTGGNTGCGWGLARQGPRGDPEGARDLP